MATVHMILQGKGGVGKSFVASTIAQYLIEGGVTPTCIDTDPVNRTFCGYEAFGAQALELMDGPQLNMRHFDQLVRVVMGAEDDAHVVVDNGAASFLPVCDYMDDIGLPALLSDEGHRLLFHSVVTGGQGMQDTVQGLLALLRTFSEVPCVVWLNPVHGPVQHGDKRFEDLGVYRNYQERIQAVVALPTERPETGGHDLRVLLKSRRTFQEALGDPSVDFVTRCRLRNTWKKIRGSVELSGAL